MNGTGRSPEMETQTTCTIRKPHCENCGSTNLEDLGNAETEGYTQCCNELEAYDASACRNHHGQAR